MGLFITLTLNEDGTAVFAESEEQGGEPVVTDCSWALGEDGVVVTREGQEIVFASEDGQLLFDNGMHVMVFDREPLADLSTRPELEVAIEDVSELFGTWRMVARFENDEMYPMDGGNEFTLEDGAYLDERFSADMDLGYEIEDGALRITIDGNFIGLEYVLMENGWLANPSFMQQYSEDGEPMVDEDGMPIGTELILYFEKVDPAEQGQTF